MRIPVRISVVCCALLLGSAAGCEREAAVPKDDTPTFSYTLGIPPAGSWALEVDATFENAPSEAFVAPESAAFVQGVTLVAGTTGRARRVVERQGNAWIVPECRTACRLKYVVDLGALAASCRGMGCARRVGDAVVGSCSVVAPPARTRRRRRSAREDRQRRPSAIRDGSSRRARR